MISGNAHTFAVVVAWSVAVLIVTGLLVSPVLRVRWPVGHWWLIGYPLIVARMLTTWRALAVQTDLTTTRRADRPIVRGLIVKGREVRPRIPLLRIGPPTRLGLTASTRLLPGQTPEQYASAAEAMSHAWRVHAVRVSSLRRGFVTLTVMATDPLTTRAPRRGSQDGRVSSRRQDPARPPRIPRARGPVESVPPCRAIPPPAVSELGSEPLLAPALPVRGLGQRGGVVGRALRYRPVAPWRHPFTPPGLLPLRGVDVLSVRVGMREDGRPWVLDMAAVPHWLITGATLSGKSNLLNALMVGLSTRPVALVGVDCKGGLALGPYRPRLSVLATDRGRAIAVLADVMTQMHRRMELCSMARVRSIWDLDEALRPVPIVIVVDEIAELYLFADRAGKDEAAQIATVLVRLGQLGASLGVHLVIAGQRVGSELGTGVTALRAQLGGRVCHRVADPETAIMTVGDLNPEAVKATLSILPTEPGVAIVADDTGAWMRARSDLVTVEDAAQVARRWAHLAPVIPGLTPLGGVEDEPPSPGGA